MSRFSRPSAPLLLMMLAQMAKAKSVQLRTLSYLGRCHCALRCSVPRTNDPADAHDVGSHFPAKDIQLRTLSYLGLLVLCLHCNTAAFPAPTTQLMLMMQLKLPRKRPRVIMAAARTAALPNPRGSNFQGNRHQCRAILQIFPEPTAQLMLMMLAQISGTLKYLGRCHYTTAFPEPRPS